MKKVYDFFGGRKLYYFNLLLVLNFILAINNKWVAEFGYFCIGLYGVAVAGVEASKLIKGKAASNE